MSFLGQSRHFGRRPTTSAHPLKTDVVRPVSMSQKCQEATLSYALFVFGSLLERARAKRGDGFETSER
jgi:hypothetical protein